jgi:hypothetical protein
LYNSLQKFLPEDCHHSFMKRLWTLFLLCGLLCLVACLPVNLVEPTETPIPTETATPTQTIVWFPPSATSTQLMVPTQTGTPEMNPGVGGVLLEDDFSDDEVWDIATSDTGSAAINRNRLTLAVQPGYYLASMRRERRDHCPPQPVPRRG